MVGQWLGLNGQLKPLTSDLIDSVRSDPRFASCRRILLDLDETVFPLGDAIRKAGIDMPPTQDIDSYGSVGEAISSNGQHPPDFFKRIHSDHQFMNDVGVYDGAPEVLRQLSDMGVEIHVVTHRDPEAKQATESWLQSAKIPYDHLEVSFEDKLDYCRRNEIETVVDDHPDLIERAERAGLDAVSLGWPYAERATKQFDGERAGDWREMGYDIISTIEDRIRLRAQKLGVELPSA